MSSKLDKLEKKLLALKELASPSMLNLESMSMPKAPKPTTNNDNQPIKPSTPETKKDPKKVAEQLKNPDTKKQAMNSIKAGANLLKFNKYGQWELDKVFPVPSSP